jgi:hypothetical protein
MPSDNAAEIDTNCGWQDLPGKNEKACFEPAQLSDRQEECGSQNIDGAV